MSSYVEDIPQYLRGIVISLSCQGTYVVSLVCLPTWKAAIPTRCCELHLDILRGLSIIIGPTWSDADTYEVTACRPTWSVWDSTGIRGVAAGWLRDVVAACATLGIHDLYRSVYIYTYTYYILHIICIYKNILLLQVHEPRVV